MKNLVKKAFVMITLVSSLSSCFSMEHTVGQGAQGAQMNTSRQWYVLWGLVPINKVDSKAMANDSENYTVKTEITPLDFVINAVTGVVSVYSQSVEVRH